MPVFIARYDRYFPYGGHHEILTIVVAETESVALGVVLSEYPNTESRHWRIERVRLEQQRVTELLDNR